MKNASDWPEVTDAISLFDRPDGKRAGVDSWYMFYGDGRKWESEGLGKNGVKHRQAEGKY